MTSQQNFNNKHDRKSEHAVKDIRLMMVKKKLDGAVDKSSADQEIRKSNANVHNL